MIITKHTQVFKDFDTDSFASNKHLVKILFKRNEFKDDLLRIFNIEETVLEVFQVGNAKALLDSLIRIDEECEKVDIQVRRKNIHLLKLLDSEKAIFEIFQVENDFITDLIRTDLLTVETRYSAKKDLLDYYHLSKFANYCRDNEYPDLLHTIKEYLKTKNANNEEPISLRLVYPYQEQKFYLRSVTSTTAYQDYGINFSVFVALVALGRYSTKTNNEVFIDRYSVTESEIYVSFQMSNEVSLSKNLSMAISLILENDEIKRSAVSFNGVVKLKYSEKGKEREIYIKPKEFRKERERFTVDLLTYPHRGKVEKVYEKITELPSIIQIFIDQISEDAPIISKIENPDDVRKLIALKVRNARKQEFLTFKDRIFALLTNINVSTTFGLFDLLRSVEDLFDHTDVVSRDFWRTKLYETLIERK